MSATPLLTPSSLKSAFADLRRDLIHPEGPQISTMQNYRFAILQYKPEDELRLRGEVQALSGQLVAAGWHVLSIDLRRLLLDRLRAMPGNFLDRLIEMERRLSTNDADRALNYIKGKIEPLIEGVDGLAADCARIIDAHAAAHPDRLDHTVVLIGRVGALYPFFRSSALLRHLDGHTHKIPVVLLYPGSRRGLTELSFMDMLPPDSDYRPRIYS
jgi:hypothetical protein